MDVAFDVQLLEETNQLDAKVDDTGDREVLFTDLQKVLNARTKFFQDYVGLFFDYSLRDNSRKSLYTCHFAHDVKLVLVDVLLGIDLHCYVLAVLLVVG